MRPRPLFAVILILSPLTLLGQLEGDSTRVNAPSKSDSVAVNISIEGDSTKTRLDSVEGLQSVAASTNHLDDSLRLIQYNSKMDSIRLVLDHRIDSLDHLHLPTDSYTKMRDSLNQLGPIKTIREATKRVNAFERGLEEKLEHPFKKVEGGINGKLSLMNSEGGGDANLPGSINLPGVNTNLPTADASLSVGNPGKMDTELGGLTGDETIPGAPNLKETIPGMEDLSKAEGEMGKVSGVAGQIDGYSQDVKNITSGDLDEVKQVPNAVERQVGKMEGVQGLQKQSQEIAQYQSLAASGSDPEALKGQALQQLPKMARNHFKGQEQLIQQAMDKMTKYKKKYTDVKSIKDLPKRKPNEMKGKPFIERVLPGITFQVQKQKNVWVDYTPTVGYRISGRILAGIGWNERLSFGKRMRVNWPDRIYGPRTYAEFRFAKGLSFRTDVEKMYTYVPPGFVITGTDPHIHDWVWSVFVGLKKEYQFIKSVKGNFQFMYNVYDQHDVSPYVNRLNVRFGFDFGMKKK